LQIKKYALSGGCENIAEHREKGANLDVDVSYLYLTFFLEDDEELKQIGDDYKRFGILSSFALQTFVCIAYIFIVNLLFSNYSSGKLLTSEVKEKLVEVMWKVVETHQKARAATTDDIVKEYMSVRELKF
jgi:tryptophanyl-tRNA synthetase